MDVCNALLCLMFDFCLIELSPFIVAVFVSLKNPHLFKEREKNPSGVHFLSYHMRHSSQFTPICIQIAKYSHTCTYLAYMYLCTVCKALKIGLRAWLGSLQWSQFNQFACNSIELNQFTCTCFQFGTIHVMLLDFSFLTFSVYFIFWVVVWFKEAIW